MPPLRAAILGCGSFAHVHARILAALSDQVEMVAFCSRNPADAQAFAAQYTGGQAAIFTDHRTMFEQAALDLVVICLPPHAHSDEVALAAEHGVHVLIEKPIALTSEQGWRMAEAAERAAIKTQVGFMFRFGEAVERLKTMLDSGEIGMAGLMSARYFCNALHADWWRARDKSGGQIVEQVIHMFDLLRYLLGDPVSVYSRQENLFHRDVPGYTVEDVSATVVGFASGALGVVYATNAAIPGKWINDYRVVAHKLTADFTSANQATFVFTDDTSRPPLVIDSQRDFRLAQTQDLLTAIRTGGDTRTPLREGARTLDLVLAAARSGETHAEVRL